MEPRDATIVFRIEESIKKEFDRIAAELDITPSQLLRRHVKDLIEDYNRRNSQKTLFETKEPPKPKKPPQQPLNREERRALAKRTKGVTRP